MGCLWFLGFEEVRWEKVEVRKLYLTDALRADSTSLGRVSLYISYVPFFGAQFGFFRDSLPVTRGLFLQPVAVGIATSSKPHVAPGSQWSFLPSMQKALKRDLGQLETHLGTRKNLAPVAIGIFHLLIMTGIQLTGG
jgi:hypothetical protein